MYCLCGNPIGTMGQNCAICGDPIPLIVSIEGGKTCPRCSRRDSYQSMEFLEHAERCPGCGKK